ncbi:heme-binding protein, partial [Acinetobacter baumannii]
AKNLTTVANLLLLGGGVPVRFENQVIGAIGVAGAGGAQNDNQCASKAIETVFRS